MLSPGPISQPVLSSCTFHIATGSMEGAGMWYWLLGGREVRGVLRPRLSHSYPCPVLALEEPMQQAQSVLCSLAVSHLMMAGVSNRGPLTPVT